jgi:hypothetical protein
MKLAGLGVPDAPDAWEAIGCRVVDGAVPLTNGSLRLGGDGLVVADVPDGVVLPGDVEGIRLSVGRRPPAVDHPCGAGELDHLVVLTTSLERTSRSIHSTLGLECRRTRDTGSTRQAFHRFDDDGERRGCIVEIVETADVAATTVMGVVLIVADLFDLVDRLGPDVLSPARPAVQPGRHISTVRRAVGLGTAVALMTPDPPH